MGRKTRGTLYKRGGTWWIEYQHQGQRFRESLGVTDRAKAEELRALRMAPLALSDEARRLEELQDRYETATRKRDAARQAEAEALRARLPIAEMWDRHPYTTNTRGSQERELSPRTVRDNRFQWGRFVAWAEGRELANAEDVTPEHARAFRDYLRRERLSPNRANKIAGLCAVMFRLAGIEPTPFDDLRKLAEKPEGRRELTETELRAVCGSATGELRTLLAVGLYTGLRLGDACTLEWSEVSPDLSRIIREPSKTSYTGSELVIPVHTVLATILAETPAGKRRGHIVPDLAERYQRNSANVSRMVTRHFTACGLRVHKPGTGKEIDPETGEKRDTGKRAVVELGFHSLRHSFVSICAREGVPLHVVQALCGHSTPAVQRLYLHHSTEDTARAIASLPAVTEDATPDPEAGKRARAAKLLEDATAEQLAAVLAMLDPGQ